LEEITEDSGLDPGVVVQDRPSGTPSMVAEVQADGTVLAARALKVTPQADTDTSGGMESNVVQGSVRFVEVAELLVNAAGLVPRPGWEDRRGNRGTLWLLALPGPQPRVPGLVGVRHAHFRGFRRAAGVRE
jgi:hypothetical protein